MRTSGLLATGLAVVLLAGCTGSDPDPEPTASASAPTADADSWTVEELAGATLDAPVADVEDDALATAEGALFQVVGEDKPARATVTAAAADDNGTTVRFVLRSLDGEEISIDAEGLSRRATGARDVRDVAIVDPVAGIRLQPFLGTSSASREDALCTCAKQPPTLSDVGGELSATFPPLDPATTEITFEIPGFPPMEGIPVSRG